MLSTIDPVSAFITACNLAGLDYSCSENVVVVSKKFPAGDKSAYCAIEDAAYRCLRLVPLKGGSIWGLDSGSIGGAIAIEKGSFHMNKSGSGKRFTSALSKRTNGMRL